ncbi:ABC transporter substrate-binding protein [Acinetobacter pittii]|uniref:ABC transporter substrate-binding protein n=1 Tax=Acinetobacter pittii TaxID=48296 RepID=UPI00083FAE6A|nr:ABC transporter substrate-binding protein [Acinetobacter pittii]MBN6519224.1 ABC transporter substrate-binding protein [Acinetobacter pittii]MBN6538204.1 ABC transporter substrate-binding protein [Acinetobacter pittii]MDV7705486.1 ABC transporter substrate-binding protein [Acinetobacter pittii]MDV7760695.1 ABC transporter substrate-binding protein [Acinetobacter pittii]ODL93847.1 ABC transporter substrate-binding protein [Acinetobacter pittii]
MASFMKKMFVSTTLVLAAVATNVQAKDWKVIRFGTESSYAPFEYKTPDGKLTGFDVDLGNAICAKLKAKCVWVENSFDGMIPALKAKKFDGILSSMTVTDERAKQIAFSSKIYNTPTRMVAKKGSPLLPTAASLKGKRVGVQQGTIQETYAKTYWAPKGVTVVPYPVQDLIYQDMMSGRLDATLQDAIMVDGAFLKQAKGKNFAFAGGNVVDAKTLGVGAAIGLRKEDADLKANINKALAAIIADGTYKKLEKKYFSFSIY